MGNIGGGNTCNYWGHSIDKSHPKFDVNFLSNLGKNQLVLFHSILTHPV